MKPDQKFFDLSRDEQMALCRSRVSVDFSGIPPAEVDAYFEGYIDGLATYRKLVADELAVCLPGHVGVANA